MEIKKDAFQDSSEKVLRPELSLETPSIYFSSETKSILSELRSQMNDEYEYGTLLQVFGGALEKNPGNLFVIRDKEKILGVGALSFENEGEATLQALYVIKEYRNQGIGAALTEARMAYLLDKGVKKIHVNITSSGARKIASGLKEKYGDIIDISDHGDYF